MIRASFIVFSVLMVVVREALAAGEVNKTNPALFDSVQLSSNDFTAITLKIDNVTWTKSGTGTTNPLFIHKNATDSSVGVTGCGLQAAPTGDPICSCSGAMYITPANVTTNTGLVSGAGLGPNGAAGTATAIQFPIFIWASFCANQYAKSPYLCQSTGATPCTVAYVAPNSGSNTTAAPGAVNIGGSTQSTGNSTKAGASMTTSQVTVLTIGPLAMLAVANFVV